MLRISPVRRDDRRARVVAGGLDREDQVRYARATRCTLRPPHDQRVLVVVVVVAAAHARRCESRTTRTSGSPRRWRPAPRACSARGRRPPRAGARSARSRRRARRWSSSHRDVHQVPDGVVARADQVADQLAVVERADADAGRLRELEHEHRQRPGRRERAALDRDHVRQVAVRRAGGSSGRARSAASVAPLGLSTRALLVISASGSLT